RPIAVRVAASASRSASTRTCSRSQFSLNFIARSSGELAQEAHVVVEETAQVVHAVAQHREPLDADAEGEAGVALRVDPDVAQHAGMDHAAAQHLEPAGRAVRLLPGNVELRGGLGEREIARAEAHFEVALVENARTNSASVPFRSLRLARSSTSRPSTWWNIGVWVWSLSER